MLKRHCRVWVVKSSAIKWDYSTVFDNSLPISIVRRHSGIISVERRKLITSVSSTWEKKKKKLFQNVQKYFAAYCGTQYINILSVLLRWIIFETLDVIEHVLIFQWRFTNTTELKAISERVTSQLQWLLKKSR